MKWFFSPPFFVCFSLFALNSARRQCYAYAIGLFTGPEKKADRMLNFCYAESLAGRVQCFKMTKIDLVSPFYLTLWLKKSNFAMGNLQEVRKTSL